MELIDKQLAKRAKTGDRTAFAELIDIYKDRIYHMAYRMLNNRQEAEDIAQETFLRVFTNLSKYDESYKFSTWIYRIATNLCIDRMRKKKPQHSLDETVDGEEGLDWYSRLSSQEPTPEAEVIEGELQNEVHQAIESLPGKYRAVLILKYLEDLSLAEISDVTSLPISTIKTRIHRGREALRKKLHKL